MTKVVILVPNTTHFAPQLELALTIPGAHVTALVVGDEDLAARVATSGVQAVIGVKLGREPAESLAPGIGELVWAQAPQVVVSDSSDLGRVLAGAISARCESATLTGVTELSATAALHGRYGGIVTRTVANTGTLVVMVSAGGQVPHPQPSAPITFTAVAPVGEVTVTASVPADTTSVDITTAQRILAVGRGLTAQADLDMAAACAHVLEAELGCSRPLAEGVNWMGKDRYIGVSGVSVCPQLYICAGISGQIQHLGGVKAKTIVAINKDANAPIVHQADIALIGDLYDILPAITTAIRE